MKKSDLTSNSAALPNQNSSQQSSHTIILLASGLSRRLGEAKQLLYKNGVPLINHMLQLAVSTNPQVIIVVIPKNEASIASEVAKLSDTHLHIKTVINQTPETGMGHSLYTAIEALTYFVSNKNFNDKNSNHKTVERVLIMGVDQILLDLEHANELLAGKHLVVASAYEPWQLLDTLSKDDHIERGADANHESTNLIVGLPLVIDYQLLKQWQLHISGDKGLRHLIRALSPSEIRTVFNKQLSYDIDTPEQLAYARQQGWVDK
ncbi:NTP transferase domain-containing protein [Psychrobacter sp. M9-54-1]|uniref:NTP transferase domain-containing protein n=1 Tax=Psychrobacter sp. M9-54-1 TaxID=2782386 RepID=UPI00190CE73C|nr:NTP transferase domain-containing protein [Psychrobacter sp. M9-54-1]MBK3394139.1 NTP transferase domain-containing protein [Psychrobacter sp. M9-54-1]